MNIIWIFDNPLIPEAGGTERVTDLIQKGLSQKGHTCFGVLEIDETRGIVSYNDTTVPNIYNFLLEKRIDIVINQKANTKSFLSYFINHGGGKWQSEGGKIITCLHFNPEPLSNYYYYKTLRKKSIKSYLLMIRSKVMNTKETQEQDIKSLEHYGYLYDNSNVFLILSDSHKPYIEKVLKGRDLSKIHSIPNPLTFSNLKAEEFLKQKKNTVLIVSRMDEYYKRISIALKAWNICCKKGKIKDWTLKIVGEGPYLKDYQEYVKKKKIANVIFEGRKMPLEYYKEAQIFLMTSISEGLPMTILESFQCGVVPVVMNSCPIFTEIIQDNENGLLCRNNNINEFASKICYLMENEHKRNKMAENAIKSANKYTGEVIISQWEELISSF